MPRWAKCFVFLEIEPSAVLFWALGIVLAHILYCNSQVTQPQVTQPAGLASLNRSTSTALYGNGKLGSA